MVGENRIARFGVFELDVNGATLRKSGVRVKLQDQPLQILSVLLERPGEIVTREELCRRLWPDGTFVDFDHSLNASVNKLRDALGDTASNPRFIETAPRRGYRFIAPVERTAPAPSIEPAVPPPSIVKPRSRTRIIAATGAVLAVAAAAAAAWWQSKQQPDGAFNVLPLTSTPGFELQPSFSPDGNYVAYSGGARGFPQMDIFVQQVGSETVRQITADAAPDVSPRWSPDGRQIAFARLLGDGEPAEFEVLVTPPLGGVERRVGTGWIRYRTNILARLLDWFPDSENIVIPDAGAAGQLAALFGMNTRTGDRWRLTTPAQIGSGDFEPAVSPDGRRLAFTRYTAHDKSDIYLLDLDANRRPAGEARVLVSGATARAPAWTSDGRNILFTSGAFHRGRLSRVRAAPGAVPELLPFAVEGTWGLQCAISARGQVAYPVSRGDIDVYRTELGPGSGRSVRFLKSTFIEHLPEYSPDGKRIAFVSNRSGSQQIWISDFDGGNWYQLTSLPEDMEATWPRWSPDGRRLVFTVNRSAYLVSSEGGAPQLRFKDIASREAIADWSPDGRWLYLISNRSGRDEVWKAPADGVDGDLTVQVTRNGAESVRVAPAGDFVYYARGSRNSEIWRVGVDGKDAVRIAGQLSTNGNYAVTAEGLYFIPGAGQFGTAKLMFIDPKTLSHREIGPVEGSPMWGLTLSPDRRYVLYSAASEGESDLMLVENFR